MRRPPDKRTPAQGGRSDLSWRMDHRHPYRNPPPLSSLPPLVDMHLGGDFLRGFEAGRAAK